MRRHGEGSVYLRKDGRYEALLRYSDSQGRSQRARAYGKTEKEARQALRQMIRRIEDGEAVRDSSMSLGDWCERWVATTLAASPRRITTQQTYAALLRTHVVPRLGHVALNRLSTRQVEDFILELRGTRSASTVRQVHLILVMVLDAAVKHELLRRNAARGVDRPQRKRREAPHYSSHVVAELLHAAVGDRLEPFLRLTAFTGLRKGEALALRWSDVDIETEEPHLRVTGTLARIGNSLVRTEPKTQAGRRAVPLVPEAVASLRDARRRQKRERLAVGPAWTDSGYVFTTEIGTPVDPRNALRWFYTIRQRVRVELMVKDDSCDHSHDLALSVRACPTCNRDVNSYLDGSLHTLRHSAASVLLSAGVPMPIVKDVLGHSSIAVTVDLYGHMAPAVVAAAMNKGMAGYGTGV